MSQHVRVSFSAAAAVLLVGLGTARGVMQEAPQAPAEQGAIARLPPSEAARAAREAQAAAGVEVADGLAVHVWAPEGLVADPLAIDVSPDGVVYVAASPRSGQLLDIRQHPDWVPVVHSLKTVEDLRQFFRRVMAPERSEQNTWLPDYNEDGSRDYRDLTVITERIYRVEDTDGDGVADSSLVAFAGFNEDVASDIAGGLLLHDAGLYVAAAPDLWRLRDTNGDQIFDERRSISHGYSIHPAFSGHDLSAVTQGPDGRIYWKVGDIGLNVVDPSGKRWAYPNQGAVMRANPDGSGFEVFATGLRNTQEIAFDEYGNLVSVDNDGDHSGETERVVYITLGSEAGWRSTWQYGKYTDPKNNPYNVWMEEGLFRPHFAGQAAYITPPIAAYHAGPSGFAYNPGTAIADRFHDSFFVTSFTGGAANARVFAFQLEPDGAGFKLANDTEIVRGVLSPGLKIGPDGAMYLTDWVRGWGATGEGKIWRLDTPGAATSPMRVEVRTLLNDDFTATAVGDLRTLIGHADMRVRLRAQFELVRRRDAASLAAVAGETGRQLARVHALWGLGQLARAQIDHAEAVRPFLRDGDPEIRAQAAKVLGDVRDAASAQPLMALLADPAPRARFFAAEALGRVGDRTAVEPIVRMLAENNNEDVYLRTAGIHALASIGDAAALGRLSSHDSRAVRLAAVVALRRLHDPGVAEFVDDADELVVTEAARAINDEGGIVAALPALAGVLTRPVRSEALLRRALNANLRLGTAEAADRVGAFAAKPSTPEAMRVEAIAILGVWGAPSTMDRVDGAWLGELQGRDAAPAQAAISVLLPLLDDSSTSEAVKVAVINAAASLQMRAAGARMLARLRQDASADVRIAALQGLRTLGGTEVEEGVRTALEDRDTRVRMAAISAMPEMPISAAAKADHLRGVINATSVPMGERQSAVAALGEVAGADARQALGSLFDRLTAGTLAPELQLDLMLAARASGDESLLARLDEVKVGRGVESVAAVFPQALQVGGVAARGRQIAMQHPAAQCTRCHTIGNATSTVGPNLNGIGAQLSRAQLLESLVTPNARIAPGFGSVSVTLANGQRVDGILREETGTELVLGVGDTGQETRRIAKAEITERSSAASAMPPMGALLQPGEIRDVVEFLAGQR